MPIAAKVNALFCLEQVALGKLQVQFVFKKRSYLFAAIVQIIFVVGKQNKIVAKSLVIRALQFMLDVIVQKRKIIIPEPLRAIIADRTILSARKAENDSVNQRHKLRVLNFAMQLVRQNPLID